MAGNFKGYHAIQEKSLRKEAVRAARSHEKCVLNHETLLKVKRDIIARKEDTHDVNVLISEAKDSRIRSWLLLMECLGKFADNYYLIDGIVYTKVSRPIRIDLNDLEDWGAKYGD